MSPVRISKLTKQDIPDLLKIEHQSSMTSWDYELFLSEFSKKSSVIFGAQKDLPGLLGYILVRQILDELHVVNLLVVQASRRQGIASLLFKKVIEEAHKLGVTKVLLEVRASNIAAFILYKNLGFNQIGTRSKYYSDNNEDAILMELILNDI